MISINSDLLYIHMIIYVIYIVILLIINVANNIEYL